MPGIERLGEVVAAVRGWQYEGAPMQLHPGDLGWFWRFGAEATAAAIRTWDRDGRIVAAGLLDGPGLLRLGIAPDSRDDEDLARELVADLSEPERGAVQGVTSVEVPPGTLVRGLLAERGWVGGEPWTPLSRDLTDPVALPPLRIETVGPGQAEARAAVQRASFDGSTFTAGHWRAMTAGPAYADARCLLAFDDRDEPVAMVSVWSAGPGRPGLIEPMGVHREHRRRGHGRAITLAGAAALRELGCSSAFVATPSENVNAVATYRSAGFEELAEVRDLTRSAEGGSLSTATTSEGAIHDER